LFQLRAIFRDREEAGQRLAERLAQLNLKDPLILAIPCGGVPVGVQIARRLKAPLDLMVVRKLQIPWNTEAGFGAVAPDGTLTLNPQIAPHLNLDERGIEEIKERTLREIRRRLHRFRGNRQPPTLSGRTVILVDDGLATGYTMLVAAQSARKAQPHKLVVATPVASTRAAQLLQPKCDTFVALHVSAAIPFAVASFYQHWHDLTDGEVLSYLSSLWGPHLPLKTDENHNSPIPQWRDT